MKYPAVPLRLAVCVPSKRRDQPQIIENGRPQIQGQCPYLSQETIHQPQAIRERPFRQLTGCAMLNRLQIDLQRREQLPDFIM
jgi:hypothetical protein